MNKSDLRILIVEDDPIISIDIKSLLKSEGFLVVGVAKDGLRAYDLLSSLSPNFAILDIHLGTGPSGIDVAEVIHDKYHIPYIFLTSFSDSDTLAAAQEQGPYGYLVKPFQDSTLITTISIAWSNWQRLQKKAPIDLHKIGVEFTQQEGKICELLIKGFSYKQLCEELFISMNTLKYHIKNIYIKADVKGRSELTALIAQQ